MSNIRCIPKTRDLSFPNGSEIFLLARCMYNGRCSRRTVSVFFSRVQLYYALFARDSRLHKDCWAGVKLQLTHTQPSLWQCGLGGQSAQDLHGCNIFVIFHHMPKDTFTCRQETAQALWGSRPPDPLAFSTAKWSGVSPNWFVMFTCP